MIFAAKQRLAIAVKLVNYTKRGQPFMNSLSMLPLLGRCGEITHLMGVITPLFFEAPRARRSARWRSPPSPRQPGQRRPRWPGGRPPARGRSASAARGAAMAPGGARSRDSSGRAPEGWRAVGRR